MQKKSIVTMAIIGFAATGFLVSQTNAFWRGDDTNSAERYQQMRTLFLESTSYEDFRTKMEAKRADRQAEREAFHNSITKTVVNLANGVEVNITSDDAEAVERLQNKSPREPREGSEINTVKTNLSNGVKIITTTENPELVERIQARAERKRNGSGRKHKRGEQMERGQEHGEQKGRTRQRGPLGGFNLSAE